MTFNLCQYKKNWDKNNHEKRALYARRWRAKHHEHVLAYNRKNDKTGEELSMSKVAFYKYKEPLQKINNGFGFQGVLIYSKNRDKIQCHICGKFFRALNNYHLQKIHKITAAEYKEQFGLRQTTALIGEGTREKLLHRLDNMPESYWIQKMKSLKRAQQIKNHPGGQKWRIEQKNLKGTCPNQLLQKIQVLANELHTTPTGKQFLNKYRGMYMGSIRATFGTYEEAVRMAKLTPHREIEAKKFSTPNLLNYFKIFYKIHKRVPRDSDHKRGLLPDFNVYINRFGSINRARLLANIPILLHTGRFRYEEWKYTKEERQKMLKFDCYSPKELNTLK